MNIDLKEQAHGEIERIFRILLPQNGLAVREEQIALCHAMLDTLLHNKIALCDAGVGIGKTYTYLTACILLKKVLSIRACRFPAGGGLHLQCGPAGRHHRRVHPILIPHLFRKPYHPETHSGHGSQGEGAVRLRCPPRPAAGGRQGEEQKRGTAESVVLS